MICKHDQLGKNRVYEIGNMGQHFVFTNTGKPRGFVMCLCVKHMSSFPFPFGDMGMDQYLLIPFLGDEHPFTSYFDIHQGYKVLTHCHIDDHSFFWVVILYPLDIPDSLERRLEVFLQRWKAALGLFKGICHKVHKCVVDTLGTNRQINSHHTSNSWDSSVGCLGSICFICTDDHYKMACLTCLIVYNGIYIIYIYTFFILFSMSIYSILFDVFDIIYIYINLNHIHMNKHT